ncbi:MAG: putative hydrolase [Acidimicrobiales bacterium]|nr:putative hydrolase [Acidimicrobiales bacterium]
MSKPAAGPRRGGPQHIPRPHSARRGDPAPWAGLSPEARRVDLARLRSVFATVGPPVRSAREAEVSRGSAVLAAVYEHGGEAHVVLTRRSAGLRVHGGEVSFPGGGRDPGEALPDTARREAHEEIGLDPASVEIIGELDHLSTITSGSFIVPYVGLLAHRPVLVASPGEVEAVLRVPLAELLDPEVYREERWVLFGAERSMFFFELFGDTVWGATAAMLRQLLGLATGTVARGELHHL